MIKFKPRIRRYGFTGWICAGPTRFERCGIGGTPAQAYEQWAQLNRLPGSGNV